MSVEMCNVIGSDGMGIVVAQYEYGPFAEPLRATGPAAADNPIRFSTKYTDSETGLLYYGYRYYSPSLGRWLRRDPVGGDYRFVSNESNSAIDPTGLVKWKYISYPKWCPKEDTLWIGIYLQFKNNDLKRLGRENYHAKIIYKGLLLMRYEVNLVVTECYRKRSRHGKRVTFYASPIVFYPSGRLAVHPDNRWEPFVDRRQYVNEQVILYACEYLYPKESWKYPCCDTKGNIEVQIAFKLLPLIDMSGPWNSKLPGFAAWNPLVNHPAGHVWGWKWMYEGSSTPPEWQNEGVYTSRTFKFSWDNCGKHIWRYEANEMPLQEGFTRQKEARRKKYCEDEVNLLARPKSER